MIWGITSAVYCTHKHKAMNMVYWISNARILDVRHGFDWSKHYFRRASTCSNICAGISQKSAAFNKQKLR